MRCVPSTARLTFHRAAAVVFVLAVLKLAVEKEATYVGHTVANEYKAVFSEKPSGIKDLSSNASFDGNTWLSEERRQPRGTGGVMLFRSPVKSKTIKKASILLFSRETATWVPSTRAGYSLWSMVAIIFAGVVTWVF